MSDKMLNEYGLVAKCRALIECRNNYSKLFEAKRMAELKFEENNRTMKGIESELGAHTRATGRPEIVLFDDLSAFIPVPPAGYEETAVGVHVCEPKKEL